MVDHHNLHNPPLVRKFFITSGDVIILTQWPLGEELTVNASTDDRCEPVRTLDDGDARLILIDIDDIKYECPGSNDSWHSMLHPVLLERISSRR